MGTGSSGAGWQAAEYYIEIGCRVYIVRMKDEEKKPMGAILISKGAVFIDRSQAIEYASKVDLVVKIPNVPVPFPVSKAARRITNDIAALMQSDSTRNIRKIIIAGGKGKTNTASALVSGLNRLGIRTALCGGLGLSAFHLLSAIGNDGKKYDAIVMELSNWQISDTYDSLSYPVPFIDIVAITDDLMPSLEKLVSKSQNQYQILTPFVGKLIVNRKELMSLIRSSVIDRRKIKAFPSLSNPCKKTAALELAWECMRSYGCRKKDIEKALSGYKGIPHRSEMVKDINGISFINDSASVIPSSVTFSLSTMRGVPVHLIIGGDEASRNNLSGFEETLNEPVSITLLKGAFSDRIREILDSCAIPYSGPFDLHDAVISAYSKALGHKGSRSRLEIVLFCPGAYPDSSFGNEYERGDAFKAEVARL